MQGVLSLSLLPPCVIHTRGAVRLKIPRIIRILISFRGPAATRFSSERQSRNDWRGGAGGAIAWPRLSYARKGVTLMSLI